MLGHDDVSVLRVRFQTLVYLCAPRAFLKRCRALDGNEGPVHKLPIGERMSVLLLVEAIEDGDLVLAGSCYKLFQVLDGSCCLLSFQLLVR